MTRENVMLLLDKEGDFVVRESATRQGEFVLAVMHADGAKHLKIEVFEVRCNVLFAPSL